jgi:hypothetical protein
VDNGLAINPKEMQSWVQLVTLPVFSGFFDANCVNWGGLIETRVAENSHGAYPG